MSLQPSASLGVQALRAATAYAHADRVDTRQDTPENFGAALQQALQGVVKAGQEADTQSRAALMGTGNITEVVTAIAQAELALQTTLAVRDRVVQAYQDIMRMPV